TLFQGYRRDFVTVRVFEDVHLVGEDGRFRIEVTCCAAEGVGGAGYENALFADELEKAVREQVHLLAVYAGVQLDGVGSHEEGEERRLLLLAWIFSNT